MQKKAPQNLVFFDGVCNLCNGFVDFVIQNDTHHRFGFSPLQGELAKSKLSNEDRMSLETVVVVTPTETFRKSDAVLFVLKNLPGIFRGLGAIGAIFPRGFRDYVYDFVAKNRLGWFGEKPSCRLPTPEEREVLFP